MFSIFIFVSLIMNHIPLINSLIYDFHPLVHQFYQVIYDLIKCPLPNINLQIIKCSTLIPHLISILLLKQLMIQSLSIIGKNITLIITDINFTISVRS
jgi:hypothetical protein